MKIAYPRLVIALIIINAVGIFYAITSGGTGYEVVSSLAVKYGLHEDWYYYRYMLFIFVAAILPGYACMSKPRPPIYSVLCIPAFLIVWVTITHSPHHSDQWVVSTIEFIILVYLPWVILSIGLSYGLSALLDKRRQRLQPKA